jgi:hypothetical protein
MLWAKGASSATSEKSVTFLIKQNEEVARLDNILSYRNNGVVSYGVGELLVFWAGTVQK